MDKSNKRKIQGALHQFAKKRTIQPPQYGPEPPLVEVDGPSSSGDQATEAAAVPSREHTPTSEAAAEPS